MNRLPLCARIGVLHGLIVGFFFSLWRMGTAFAALAAQEFAWGVLLLSILALLCSLFILVIVERYLAGAVFWPATVNAILVTLLTMLAINAMPPHQFFLLLGLWIGIVVGLLVGLALCRLCLNRLITTTEGVGGNHGQ
jgi:hypothetical protein